MEKIVVYGPTIYAAGRLAASMNLSLRQWDWEEDVMVWADVGAALDRLEELEEYIEGEVFT